MDRHGEFELPTSAGLGPNDTDRCRTRHPARPGLVVASRNAGEPERQGANRRRPGLY
jgi:hypothetical protein